MTVRNNAMVTTREADSDEDFRRAVERLDEALGVLDAGRQNFKMLLKWLCPSCRAKFER